MTTADIIGPIKYPWIGRGISLHFPSYLARNHSQSERGTHHAEKVSEAEEGKLLSACIKFRRRNRSLIEAKRVQCADRMQCEVCRFSFRARYGPSVKDALEVHHCNPVAERKGVRVTTIDDLALLCPNCHRAMHSVTPVVTVEELKKTLR